MVLAGDAPDAGVAAVSGLHHGGRLREAARRYNIPLEMWLDLSTGINPVGWSVPELPARCWQRLPEADDGLEAAAADYYGNQRLLPLAGSQVAIQLLPRLRPQSRVGVLSPSYAEHAEAWQRAGHEVIVLNAGSLDDMVATLDVLLLVNPNNPTAERFSAAQLIRWWEQLRRRGGWLLLDEAFMDSEPQQSMLPHCGEEGLIVLRSLGKFFGLAGIRVGFLFAWPLLLHRVARELGPWHLSGPAREVARLALQDRQWQQQSRQRLLHDSERLAALLREHGFLVNGSTTLFHYLPHPDAAQWHELLAGEGIFTRLFAAPSALRFGLPGKESEWLQLHFALQNLQQQLTRKLP